MNKFKFQQVLRRVILVPLGIAAILAVALVFGVQSIVNRMGWVDQTDQVIGTADRLFRTRVDEETGLRAYLLTRDERFLQPLRDGRNEGRNLENRLRQLISDNPGQQASNQQAMERIARGQRSLIKALQWRRLARTLATSTSSFTEKNLWIAIGRRARALLLRRSN